MKQAEVHLAFNGERWFIRWLFMRDGDQRSSIIKSYQMKSKPDGYDSAEEAADHAEQLLKVGIYDDGAADEGNT